MKGSWQLSRWGEGGALGKLYGPPPLASSSYDLNGNRTSKRLENRTTTPYDYDMVPWLSAVNHAEGAIFDPSTLDVRPSTAHSNRLSFTGREWIGEIGLYDYRNRVYSPELGRFLQTDPIRFEAGDVNLYRYVANRPGDFWDPHGEEWSEVAGIRRVNGPWSEVSRNLNVDVSTPSTGGVLILLVPGKEISLLWKAEGSVECECSTTGEKKIANGTLELENFAATTTFFTHIHISIGGVPRNPGAMMNLIRRMGGSADQKLPEQIENAIRRSKPTDGTLPSGSNWKGGDSPCASL